MKKRSGYVRIYSPYLATYIATTCKSKTVATSILVGIAALIATQVCDLCHEILLVDRALVENHITDSSMYVPLSVLGEKHQVYTYMMFS